MKLYSPPATFRPNAYHRALTLFRVYSRTFKLSGSRLATASKLASLRCCYAAQQLLLLGRKNPSSRRSMILSRSSSVSCSNLNPLSSKRHSYILSHVYYKEINMDSLKHASTNVHLFYGFNNSPKDAAQSTQAWWLWNLDHLLYSNLNPLCLNLFKFKPSVVDKA